MRRYLHQIDVDLKRAVSQKAKQLGFGFNFCGHEIENDDPQRSDILMHGTVFGHDKYILRIQNFGGGQIIRNFNWHKPNLPFQ